MGKPVARRRDVPSERSDWWKYTAIAALSGCLTLGAAGLKDFATEVFGPKVATAEQVEAMTAELHQLKAAVSEINDTMGYYGVTKEGVRRELEKARQLRGGE